VMAQQIAQVDRGITVQARPRPDYDAIGAPVGRFLLFPAATLDVVYDDNILAADESTPRLILSDTLLFLAPEIALRSDWSRHQLNVGAKAESARFNDFASQDWTDYRLFGDGYLEFGSNKLDASASHNKLHELRTSATDQRQGIFPTEYTLDKVGVGYLYAPNRLFASVKVDFATFEYDDAFRLNPPEIIDNSDRDRFNSELRLRLGYLVSPDNSWYLESRIYDFDYDTAVDRYDNNLDQNGYDIVVGSEFDASAVISGSAFAGYRNIEYEDTQFETQKGPLFGANIAWNVTQLTTISLLGTQRLYGTNVANSSGVEARTLGVAVDHELRRNVILSLALQAIDEDFLQIPREDEVARINLGAEYMFTRNWGLNLGYRYQKRDSNIDSVRQFRVNQFFLGIRGQI
jgi:hypothetical protein